MGRGLCSEFCMWESTRGQRVRITASACRAHCPACPTASAHSSGFSSHLFPDCSVTWEPDPQRLHSWAPLPSGLQLGKVDASPGEETGSRWVEAWSCCREYEITRWVGIQSERWEALRKREVPSQIDKLEMMLRARGRQGSKGWGAPEVGSALPGRQGLGGRENGSGLQHRGRGSAPGFVCLSTTWRVQPQKDLVEVSLFSLLGLYQPQKAGGHLSLRRRVSLSLFAGAKTESEQMVHEPTAMPHFKEFIFRPSPSRRDGGISRSLCPEISKSFHGTRDINLYRTPWFLPFIQNLFVLPKYLPSPTPRRKTFSAKVYDVSRRNPPNSNDKQLDPGPPDMRMKSSKQDHKIKTGRKQSKGWGCQWRWLAYAWEAWTGAGGFLRTWVLRATIFNPSWSCDILSFICLLWSSTTSSQKRIFKIRGNHFILERMLLLLISLRITLEDHSCRSSDRWLSIQRLLLGALFLSSWWAFKNSKECGQKKESWRETFQVCTGRFEIHPEEEQMDIGMLFASSLMHIDTISLRQMLWMLKPSLQRSYFSDSPQCKLHWAKPFS